MVGGEWRRGRGPTPTRGHWRTCKKMSWASSTPSTPRPSSMPSTTATSSSAPSSQSSGFRRASSASSVSSSIYSGERSSFRRSSRKPAVKQPNTKLLKFARRRRIERETRAQYPISQESFYDCYRAQASQFGCQFSVAHKDLALGTIPTTTFSPTCCRQVVDQLLAR